MSHAKPDAGEPTSADAASQAGRRLVPRRWRVLVLATFVVAGALFVTSALDSRAGALRTSGVTDLATLVSEQRGDTDTLQQRLNLLNKQVSRLTRTVDDPEVKKLQAQVNAVEGPAGLTPVSGPGLTITLHDAPDDVIKRALADGTPEPEKLVVHQQDIQAVVNALWVGGATAMSIQNQRIISTTGIKCAGPTVILHGVPYSPPYVIRAVGDPALLVAAIDSSTWIDAYREVANDYGLGFAEQSSGDLAVPGYQGTLELRYAKALPAGRSSS